MIICVVAKEPRPGFVKTRLSPPFTPTEAAELAEACLRDTLVAVADTPAKARVIALDGAPGPWLPDDFAVVSQPDGPFGVRLEAAMTAGFEAYPEGPVLLIGMDTPQLTSDDLVAAATLLGDDSSRGADQPATAVLGPASDGGYWLIGLSRPLPGAFDGVPMSTSVTAATQSRRLQSLGCRVLTTRALTDVDDVASARSVAASAPDTWFARTLATMADAAH